MSAEVIALFLLTCLAASTVQTISGFGFGIFVMMILPYFMPSYLACVAISGLMGTTCCLIRAAGARKNIQWRMLAPPVAGFVISAAAIIFFAAGQADELLKKLLGAALVLMGLYFIFLSHKVKIRPTFLNGFLIGLLGGVFDGLFGTGGPPAVVYFINATENNDEYIATINTYFAFSGVFSSSMRAVNGMITTEVLTFCAVGVAVLFAGIFAGGKLFAKINAAALKRIVYGLMGVSGVIMLI